MAPAILTLLFLLVASFVWSFDNAATWVLVTGLVLVALSFLALFWSPLPHTPLPTGAFAVGLELIDVACDDAVAREKTQLHIWYPVAELGGQKPRRFFTRTEAHAHSEAMKSLGAPGFLRRHFQLARTHSHEKARPADGKFPLVVFNHGGAMWPTTNLSLMEELASHGHVVCSIAHPGESAAIVWADGQSTLIDRDYVGTLLGNENAVSDHANFLLCQDKTKKRELLAILKESYRESLTASTDRWATQSIAVVDWLLSDTPETPVARISENIDRNKVIYCGMSLGGSVAHECCYRDARSAAGINLDGMNWTFERLGLEVPVPFLQLYNDPTVGAEAIVARATASLKAPENLTPTLGMYNDFYYESAETVGEREDVLRVIVPGSAHMSFTDLALSARGPMRRVSGTGHTVGRKTTRAINSLCGHLLKMQLLAEALRLLGTWRAAVTHF